MLLCVYHFPLLPPPPCALRPHQHTDSPCPPHGVPGLVLSMHYVEGYGANTLTDGFAVARALREADPDAFDLLATWGYDGERDLAASRKDSTQAHAAGLVIHRKHPIFELDANGELSRVQFNEVFRTPLSLPFDVFPKVREGTAGGDHHRERACVGAPRRAPRERSRALSRLH